MCANSVVPVCGGAGHGEHETLFWPVLDRLDMSYDHFMGYVTTICWEMEAFEDMEETMREIVKDAIREAVIKKAKKFLDAPSPRALLGEIVKHVVVDITSPREQVSAHFSSLELALETLKDLGIDRALKLCKRRGADGSYRCSGRLYYNKRKRLEQDPRPARVESRGARFSRIETWKARRRDVDLETLQTPCEVGTNYSALWESLRRYRLQSPDRGTALYMVGSGDYTQKEAAKHLGLTYGQFRRTYRKGLEEFASEYPDLRDLLGGDHPFSIL